MKFSEMPLVDHTLVQHLYIGVPSVCFDAAEKISDILRRTLKVLAEPFTVEYEHQGNDLDLEVFT